jgi:hypothetical protein
MLDCLCPCGFDNPRNTLRWKLLQLAPIRLRINLFGLRTANTDSVAATDSVEAGSTHSWRERTWWIIVRNRLSSTKDKVADVVVDRRNECWWGQWWRLTLGHDSQYEIVQGLWSSCPVKGVSNPTRIRWVDKKNEKDELFENSIQAYIQYPE